MYGLSDAVGAGVVFLYGDHVVVGAAEGTVAPEEPGGSCVPGQVWWVALGSG